MPGVLNFGSSVVARNDPLGRAASILQSALIPFAQSVQRSREIADEHALRRKMLADRMWGSAIENLAGNISGVLGPRLEASRENQAITSLVDTLKSPPPDPKTALPMTAWMNGEDGGSLVGNAARAVEQSRPMATLDAALDWAKRNADTRIGKTILGTVVNQQLTNAMKPSLLTPEEKREAALIHAGLAPRAVTPKAVTPRPPDPNADVKRKKIEADIALADQRRRTSAATTQPAAKTAGKAGIGSQADVDRILKGLSNYRWKDGDPNRGLEYRTKANKDNPAKDVWQLATPDQYSGYVIMQNALKQYRKRADERSESLSGATSSAATPAPVTQPAMPARPVESGMRLPTGTDVLYGTLTAKIAQMAPEYQEWLSRQDDQNKAIRILQAKGVLR